MNSLFILASAIAILSTLMVITRTNIIHGLLYLIVSFLAVALIFYLLGAPFIAALEVIIYAGAIMVLFVFAVMVLNPEIQGGRQEMNMKQPGAWLGPAILTLVLGLELVYTFAQIGGTPTNVTSVSPQQVGAALYGPYLLGVEMASMLLLSGLVGAYHLGSGRSSNESRGGG